MDNRDKQVAPLVYMNRRTTQYRRIGSRFGGSLVGSVLALSAMTGTALAHSGDSGLHHHDGWMGFNTGMDSWVFGGGFFWMLFGIVLLLGLPITIIYLSFTRKVSYGEPEKDALSVLRRRYARGEISAEEFESRRTTLLAEQET